MHIQVAAAGNGYKEQASFQPQQMLPMYPVTQQVKHVLQPSAVSMSSRPIA